MDENKKACDLCGLPVEIKDFKLRTRDGDKEFCCEGCQGIYQMLHEEAVLGEPDEIDETE